MTHTVRPPYFERWFVQQGELFVINEYSPINPDGVTWHAVNECCRVNSSVLRMMNFIPSRLHFQWLICQDSLLSLSLSCLSPFSSLSLSRPLSPSSACLSRSSNLYVSAVYFSFCPCLSSFFLSAQKFLSALSFSLLFLSSYLSFFLFPISFYFLSVCAVCGRMMQSLLFETRRNRGSALSTH